MFSFDFYRAQLDRLLSEPIITPALRNGYRRECDRLLLRKLEGAIRNRDMHIRRAADMAINGRAAAAKELEAHLRTALFEVLSSPSITRAIASLGETIGDRIDLLLTDQLDRDWHGIPSLMGLGLEDDPKSWDSRDRFNLAYGAMQQLITLHQDTRNLYGKHVRAIRRARDHDIPDLSARIDAFHADCSLTVIIRAPWEQSPQLAAPTPATPRKPRRRTSQKWTGARVAAAR